MGMGAEALFLTGAGVSALGGLSAADQQADALGYNEKVAKLQAEDAKARGHLDVLRLRLDLRKLIGSQRVQAAAQGIAIDDGSALQAQTDAAFMAELDAETIRNNAAREAWGYQVQAHKFATQAQQVKAAATNNAIAGLLGAGAQVAGPGTLIPSWGGGGGTGASAIGGGG